VIKARGESAPHGSRSGLQASSQPVGRRPDGPNPSENSIAKSKKHRVA